MIAFFCVYSFSIFEKIQTTQLKNSFSILIVFLLLLGCSQKSNDDKITEPSVDSLATYLSLANDVNLPYDYKKKYTEKAFNIVVNQKDDSLNKVNLFKVANRYYNMGDWESYKNVSNIILERVEKTQDSANMAKAHTYLGDYYSFGGVSDSAFLNYYEAEKLYRNLKDEYNLAKTLLSKASLQFNEGGFFDCEITVFKALQVLKQKKNYNDLFYNAYNLLGVLYNEREECNKALEFHNKALIALENKDKSSDFILKAASLNNIGFVYLNMDDYNRAKFFFQSGLAQRNLFKDNAGLYAMLLDNLAYAKFKSKNFENLPDQFYKALKIRDSLKLSSGIVLSKVHLSEFFAYKKDTLRAVQYSKQALLLSRRSNRFKNTLEVLKQVALVDPANANLYSKEYIRINEKMQKNERNMGEKFSRIEFETDEVKDENALLNTKYKSLIYGFSVFGLIVMFLYIYNLQKTKNRELLFKQQQQIANEDIYNLMISQQNAIEAIRIKDKKRVAQDLHDGILGRLFGVRISLDSLDKFDDVNASEKRKQYLLELKGIEQDIREISHELNKEKSELINNFVAIIEKLFEKQRETFPSKLISTIDSSIKWVLIENSIKINLYRILQEALQNCNKYAQAETITVELKNELDYLLLLIGDNGVGFNVKSTKKGIGLQNIFYRTKECNGTVAIKSYINEGTTIEVRIPIDQKINLQSNDS